MLWLKAVSGLIFDGMLSHYMPSDYQIQGSSSSINWTSLSLIEPLSLRWGVLSAVSKAIQVCVCAIQQPIIAVTSLLLDDLDRMHTAFVRGIVGE